MSHLPSRVLGTQKKEMGICPVIFPPSFLSTKMGKHYFYFYSSVILQDFLELCEVLLVVRKTGKCNSHLAEQDQGTRCVTMLKSSLCKGAFKSLFKIIALLR